VFVREPEEAQVRSGDDRLGIAGGRTFHRSALSFSLPRPLHIRSARVPPLVEMALVHLVVGDASSFG
jgi:hypothetical protein